MLIVQCAVFSPQLSLNSIVVLQTAAREHAMIATCQSQGSHALQQTLLYHPFYSK